MSSFTSTYLGILVLLLQVWSGEGSERCPGFDKDTYLFVVRSLEQGQAVGTVHFNCSGQKGLNFYTDDARFQVQSDGRVLAKTSLLPEKQSSFFITAHNQAGEEWDATIKVIINGEKLKDSAKGQSDTTLIMFPPHHTDSVLRRQKREWVIPVINFPENNRGPFPKDVVKIASSRQKEIRLFYSVSGPGVDQPPIGVFSIDKNSGVIYVHQPLDREQIPNYNLMALATNIEGTNIEDPIDIFIKVIDMNDNRPQFTSPTFYGSVPEGATPGTAFMNVTATDADEKDNDNSVIGYSIVSQAPEQPMMFTISSTTGLITVLQAGLDRKNVNQYKLLIQAADAKGMGLITTATAIITVTDTNDNAPQFVTKSAKLSDERQQQRTGGGQLQLQLLSDLKECVQRIAGSRVIDPVATGEANPVLVSNDGDSPGKEMGPQAATGSEAEGEEEDEAGAAAPPSPEEAHAYTGNTSSLEGSRGEGSDEGEAPELNGLQQRNGGREAQPLSPAALDAEEERLITEMSAQVVHRHTELTGAVRRVPKCIKSLARSVEHFAVAQANATQMFSAAIQSLAAMTPSLTALMQTQIEATRALTAAILSGSDIFPRAAAGQQSVLQPEGQTAATHAELEQSAVRPSRPRAGRGHPSRASAVSGSDNQQPSTSLAAATGVPLQRSSRVGRGEVQKGRRSPSKGKK